MNRRSELGMLMGVAAVAAAAGMAIGGMPDLGAGPEAVQVISPEPDQTVTPDTTSTTLPALTTTTTSTTTTSTTTTEPAPEPRPNDEVTVLVVNGTNVVGAAGRLSEQLSGEGYPTLTPTGTSPYAVSEVWFAEGYGIEAVALAQRLGVFPENVMLIPDNPGFSPGAASVVVIIGPDLAGS
jgi:hypothetical protein